MTKVEELRDKVLRYKVDDYVEHDVEDGYAVRDICVVGTDDLDSLISAAHAEGVAEERDRIRQGSKYLDCEYEGSEDRTLSFWHVPASVLAPTKEGEK